MTEIEAELRPPVVTPEPMPAPPAAVPPAPPRVPWTPPAAGALWAAAALVGCASALSLAVLGVASFDAPDGSLIVPLVFGEWLFAVAPLSLGIGGLLARLEAVTAPRLPSRAAWLQRAVSRLGWVWFAPHLLLTPAHALAVMTGTWRAEEHLITAAATVLLWIAAALLGWSDLRASRRLAARTEIGAQSVSTLDRIPSGVWVGLLAAIGVGGPGALLAATTIDQGEPMVFFALWCFVAGFITVLAALLRGTLWGLVGALPRTPGQRAIAMGAAVWAALWLPAYLVALAPWPNADEHAARLVLSVLSAAALLPAVGAAAWVRAEDRPAR